MFGELFVVLDDFEQISSGTILCYFPHVIFGLKEIVETNDILVA
jgi:hypothetical protein